MKGIFKTINESLKDLETKVKEKTDELETSNAALEAAEQEIRELQLELDERLKIPDHMKTVRNTSALEEFNKHFVSGRITIEDLEELNRRANA